MAPPSDTSEVGGGSSPVSSHAGTTDASVPSTPSAAPIGCTSGGASESSSTSDSAALDSTPRPSSRSAADAPEASSGVGSAGS
ncbi:unnamed protein product [Phytophthora fragariaefolia]|uniref:Unnamed protein product n=1 Tax=Phytophthora fragariaefolia TaxID=1490495 RepID=A0A9W6XUH5_9STRA|nr:unnamed protein product [Phytophthora fragariaefolia]